MSIKRLKEIMAKRIMNEKGFTLVEMMVVAILVGVLAAIAVPAYTGNRRKAQITEATGIIGQIKERIIAARSDEDPNTDVDGCPTGVPTVTATDIDLLYGTAIDSEDYYFTYSIAGCVITATSTARFIDGGGQTITYTTTAVPGARWAGGGTIVAGRHLPAK